MLVSACVVKRRQNVWSIKWEVPGQEVDQRKLGERLRKKTVGRVN